MGKPHLPAAGRRHTLAAVHGLQVVEEPIPMTRH
jgi:hypothetical protein